MENYKRLMENVNIWRGFFNSLFISTCVTILSGYFSALTAYGFSKFNFKGNKTLYWVVQEECIKQTLALFIQE